MGSIRSGGGTAARLDPVGRWRLPRRGTAVRAALVAVLLLTAAAALFGMDAPDTSELDTAELDTADQDPSALDTADPDTVEAHLDNQPRPASSAHTGSDRARLPIPQHLVGVPVPMGEPATLAVLRPGDQVALLTLPSSGDGEPVPIADGAAVLAVDREAATLLLALPPAQAREVLSTPVATRFAVMVRPRHP